MRFLIVAVNVALILPFVVFSQSSPNIQPIDIDRNESFAGFDLIELQEKKLFVLAEQWHNIGKVPRATMKTLRYLHSTANVRILAIEQGASVAMMVNSYLKTGDTTMLQHITRNTMFWGIENRRFFWELRQFNLSVPPEDQVIVESIDIEYKMESAIFMINQLLQDRTIPKPLQATLKPFKNLYDETKEHREQYDGLSIMFYYDRAYVQQLLINAIDDLERNSQQYISFFKDRFSTFATMILEMDDGLTFDYTNPNTNYKFRDNIIQQKFEDLVNEHPDKGILSVIGMRHTTKGSSLSKLALEKSSPLKDQIMIIRLSALHLKMINSGDLRKINFNYPKQLKTNEATLIRHIDADPILKSKKGKRFDYTLFINDSGTLTPFNNVLTEQ